MERRGWDPNAQKRREEAAIRLEQRFEDFLERYESNERIRSDRFERLERRIGPIEELVMQARTPVRLLISVLSLVTASLILDYGLKIFHWMKETWR